MSLTDWIVLGCSRRSRVTASPWPVSSRPTRRSGRCGPSVARSSTARWTTSSANGLIEATRTEPGTQGPQRTVFRARRAVRELTLAGSTRPSAHPAERPRRAVREVHPPPGTSWRPAHTVGRARLLEWFAPVTGGVCRVPRAATATELHRVVARWRLESTRAIARTLDAIVADEARGVLDGAAVASLRASRARGDTDDRPLLDEIDFGNTSSGTAPTGDGISPSSAPSARSRGTPSPRSRRSAVAPGPGFWSLTRYDDVHARQPAPRAVHLGQGHEHPRLPARGLRVPRLDDQHGPAAPHAVPAAS